MESHKDQLCFFVSLAINVNTNNIAFPVKSTIYADGLNIVFCSSNKIETAQTYLHCSVNKLDE